MLLRSVLLLGVLVVSGGMTGCRTASQEIPIVSQPPGAEVYVDGERRGLTPVTIELSKDQAHRLELRLEGYRPYRTLLTAAEAENAPYVKFGLLYDAGHYNEFTLPNGPIQLESELLPTSRSPNPFGDLGTRVVQLDAQLAQGRINPDEHARILAELLAAYGE